jgi:class 3 adenylate cyclase
MDPTAPERPPLRDAPAPEPAANLNLQAAVLVVDDSRTMRLALIRALNNLGFKNITEAVNGRQALEMIRRQSFDLMLLDIEMPEMNGIQVLFELRNDPQLNGLPVIVISGAEQEDTAVKCIEAGAEDYLPKPFNPTLLRARVTTSLEKKRLRDLDRLRLDQLHVEKQRSDDLLHIILPEYVANELKATNAVRPRLVGEVGVLFSDIVGFTSFCHSHSPEEVMDYLQSLVETFEKIVARHGLEKIKTIGDAFMATAGMSGPIENPAMNCVACGLEMIAAAAAQPPYWQLRVGVHVGAVVGGVVGKRKYQFDVWGDTVNTAARMEQSGLPGNLTLSAQAWERTKQSYHGVSLGTIEVKGKGGMEIFRIERPR